MCGGPYLHSDRMARDISASIPAIPIPARADISAPAQIRRIETQPGDDRKGVARPGINGHPSPAAAFAITHQVARRQRRGEQSPSMQRVRDRTRAIVSAVVERPVPAAPDIGLATNGVRGPNRILHALWRVGRRIGDSITQNCPASRHHRPIAAPFDLRTFLLLILILILPIFTIWPDSAGSWRCRIRSPDWSRGFFVKTVHLFTAGRPGSQPSRGIVGDLYRRYCRCNQDAMRVVDDWRRDRMNH